MTMTRDEVLTAEEVEGKNKEKQIAELEKQNKELQEDLDHKKIAIQTRKARIKELEKQIEKMKCCANCCNWYKGMRDENNYPCDQNNAEHKCSMWELAE